MLTSWNALAIRGLAARRARPARPDLAAAATRALDFLRAHLWCDGRLLADRKDGRAQPPAYLDDHALLAGGPRAAAGALARRRPAIRRELLEALLAHFEDREAGGFFFTADDHEALLHRPKSFADEATPSGNGVAAQRAAAAGFPARRAALDRRGRAHAAGGLAVAREIPARPRLDAECARRLPAPPQAVVLRGAAAGVERWRAELDRLYAPQRILLAIPADATSLPSGLADKRPGAAPGGVIAYLCEGSQCAAPIDDLAELVRHLRLRLDAPLGEPR